VRLKRPLIVVGVILGILIALTLLMMYLSDVPTDVYSEID
jgi:hypothetical protein